VGEVFYYALNWGVDVAGDGGLVDDEIAVAGVQVEF